MCRTRDRVLSKPSIPGGYPMAGSALSHTAIRPQDTASSRNSCRKYSPPRHKSQAQTMVHLHVQCRLVIIRATNGFACQGKRTTDHTDDTDYYGPKTESRIAAQ